MNNNTLVHLTLTLAFTAVLAACTSPSHTGGTLVSQADELTQRLINPDGQVMVVAHRACWRLAPENSLAAIQACIANHIDIVEIDVQRSQDGHLVVIHDLSVDRTTDGTGLVSDMTLAQLQLLRLKEFNGGDVANLTSQSIPTLAQAFTATRGKVLVNLDAKADVRDQAYALAEEMGLLDQIIIKMPLTHPGEELSSFNFYGNTFFMPIVHEKNGDLGMMVKNFDAEPQVAYEVIYKTEAGLRAACAAASAQNSRCWLNTLWEGLSPGHSDERNLDNPDAHWGYVIKELGVNMIQTDRPIMLTQYLQSKDLHD
ncbi:glycerophosphodiester phosphodiesterase family protein [Shewanella sp.]|uniref:glycerophosphodiester phosphodiesterase family protein n=1 Tax=Shewanella sp. TaxID=50422 RepID=UPI001EC4D9CD|nr:glycerophosphodiester phosphodiesterase family protein [Shewanella sp.]NRB24512.1 glycerophosphodiester phosphodiesterase family protein [Shewanella sp.]